MIIDDGTRDAALAAQRAWVLSQGLSPNRGGYLATVEQNLFEGRMSGAARAAFDKGAGSELKGRDGGAAKMQALHSSSALAVNAFDGWSSVDGQPVDRRALEDALGVPRGSTQLTFEHECETGMRGTPPTLDVLLGYADGSVVGIESKFTEWMAVKPKGKAFAASYFADDRTRWAAVGLPHAQRIARRIYDETEHYALLDAPQLLKHALGLARQAQLLGGGARAVLRYVYVDWPSEMGAVHRAEMQRFTEALQGELDFRALPYDAWLGSIDAGADAGLAARLRWVTARYLSAR